MKNKKFEILINSMAEHICNYFNVPDDDTEAFYEVFDLIIEEIFYKERFDTPEPGMHTWQVPGGGIEKWVSEAEKTVLQIPLEIKGGVIK